MTVEYDGRDFRGARKVIPLRALGVLLVFTAAASSGCRSDDGPQYGLLSDPWFDEPLHVEYWPGRDDQVRAGFRFDPRKLAHLYPDESLKIIVGVPERGYSRSPSCLGTWCLEFTRKKRIYITVCVVMGRPEAAQKAMVSHLHQGSSPPQYAKSPELGDVTLSSWDGDVAFSRDNVFVHVHGCPEIIAWRAAEAIDAQLREAPVTTLAKLPLWLPVLAKPLLPGNVVPHGTVGELCIKFEDPQSSRVTVTRVDEKSRNGSLTQRGDRYRLYCRGDRLESCLVEIRYYTDHLLTGRVEVPVTFLP